MKKPFIFPDSFLLGTATASLQIEGGDKNSNWYRWSEAGKIKDGSHSLNACDHWNRVDEDLELHKEIHAQTYRMGLEWSRIEPTRGSFSKDALEHYRNEIQGLLANGIRPLVTLYHFSHPLWFEDSGGWTQPDAPQIFLHYVAEVVKALGDLVQDWVTINEPNIYLTLAYVRGEWPPGKTDAVEEMLVAGRLMVKAHCEAYKVIHAAYDTSRKVSVGVAHHLRVFQPAGGPISWISSYLHTRIFQAMFLEAMTTGKWMAPLGKGYPSGKGPFSDFIGINYYTRDMVKGDLRAKPLMGVLGKQKNASYNDLGWEIYPKGLGILIRRVWKKYRLPIWITENGICDADDDQRPQFLRDHLEEVGLCIQEGIPVERYYHWTLLDNFEWIEGESAPFGLFHTDFNTQKRTLRESGKFFSKIIKTRSLD